MLDNVVWKVFEKTGSIDIYLLYSNIKEADTKAEEEHKQDGDKIHPR